MLIRLLNRNADLRRLANDGYKLSWNAGHLLVHNVPYATPDKTVAMGTLVIKLEVQPDETVRMADHTILFVSEPRGIPPCDLDGKPLTNIGNNPSPRALTKNLEVDRQFSAKPPTPDGKYADVHAKVTRYVTILGSPAFAIDPSKTPISHPVYEDTERATPFYYFDTASTRAEITAASQKLENQVIAIIGLGGTGSYVLDLVAKTPVKEIRLFDGDDFLVHNAFRAPGAPSAEDLKQPIKKVDYLAAVYSKMRRNIRPLAERITADTVGKLAGATFVFVCIDKPSAKPPIFEYLLSNNIPFADVGLGLRLEGTSIAGATRVTTIDNEKHDHIDTIGTADAPDGVYAAAIQVADLNSLAAALAVIRWKKYAGFYVDGETEHSATYSVRLNAIFNEDHAHPP